MMMEHKLFENNVVHVAIKKLLHGACYGKRRTCVNHHQATHRFVFFLGVVRSGKGLKPPSECANLYNIC